MRCRACGRFTRERGSVTDGFVCDKDDDKHRAAVDEFIEDSSTTLTPMDYPQHAPTFGIGAPVFYSAEESEAIPAMGALVLECSRCGGMIWQRVDTERKFAQWDRYGRICPRCILKAWHEHHE